MEAGLTPPEPAEGTPGAGVPRASLFGRLTQALNVIGTLMILAMALAVNSDVLGRNLFNKPIPGVTEFLGLSIVAIVFLQMANTLREGRHVSNDLLTELVKRSNPRLHAAIYASFHAIGAFLMLLIAAYVWPIFWSNFTGGYFRGTASLVEIPIWPFMAAVPIGAVATAIQFLILMVEDLRRAVSGPAPDR
jgi:TRAP-type C4-dicarboxylate transport system permease small subunit